MFGCNLRDVRVRLGLPEKLGGGVRLWGPYKKVVVY